MVDIWLPRLSRKEQFHPQALLVALKNSTVGDLSIELIATFDLKCHTCSNLAIKEVICAARIYENGDGLLLEKSSYFHRLRVRVEGVEGFGIAGRGATLVLRASLFKHSSCSRAKEIAATRVYGCRFGDDGGGDILKQLWELLRWVEAAEMVVGAAGTWL
ncbi:hypothetical protein B296_00006404 [Ensete ventricosum]|uniref:Uncharacterized protein n=1 Tax=Ensete ventricosum TaxID=4639 RepID=A0A427B1N5_ENSVE|nr:hypothetical protein B296_00006404 [Ensete ventricosum]